MKVQVYKVNSFTKTKDGGNPAGVVLSSDQLNDNQMKQIAKEVGFSETAFVRKSDKADFELKFFTPTKEVDLCGHATIAAFSILMINNIIKSGTYTQETKAGILKVEVKEDRQILMDQNIPKFYDIIHKNEIADSLGVEIEAFEESLPIEVVSTGLKDIFIAVKTKHDLYNLEPNMALISEISKKYDSTGYHVFTLDVEDGYDAECRNFAPLYGIDEESATGTSNGALSCYMHKYDLLDKNSNPNLSIKQGYFMKQNSIINSNLTINNGLIKSVRVGGYAVITGIMDIEL
ncbi:MAG: PhzF family phenazine biosynthesis protein [Acidaminobacteraceae bacterium]